MAVNHVDVFVRSGAYATELPMPFVIGRDFVGRVVETGQDVKRFAVGDMVWCNSLGYDNRQGAFAEYVTAPSNRVYPLPKGQNPVEAVSLLHPAATAYLGLFREGGLKNGQTIVVGGAAGGVGSVAVQMAAMTGANVIGTASHRDFDWGTQCGATRVIDYHDLDCFSQIHNAATQGVDLYWDTSGHHNLRRTLPLMSLGGVIIVSAGMQASDTVPLSSFYTQDVKLRGFAISNASVEELAVAAEFINGKLHTAQLKSRIGKRVRMKDAATSHQLLESAGFKSIGGRIVVLP